MTTYSDDGRYASAEQAQGFHQDWARKVSPEELVSLWKGSEWTLFALEEDHVVGYVSVIGDGVLFAFITSLEVRPAQRGKGIGSQLINHVINRYRDRYAVDLLCDKALVPFYEGLGMTQVAGMCLRNLNTPAS